MLEAFNRTGESKSSAGLRPGGIAKYEEGETRGGDIGSEGGGSDLNLGTPEPVLSAIRSDNDNPPPRLPWLTAEEGLSSSVVPEARRSEKDVVMKGWVEKPKAF